MANVEERFCISHLLHCLLVCTPASLFIYIIFRRDKKNDIKRDQNKIHEGLPNRNHQRSIIVVRGHSRLDEQSKPCLIDNPWSSRQRQQARFDENTPKPAPLFSTSEREKEEKKRRRRRRRKVIETRKVWNEERTSVYTRWYKGTKQRCRLSSLLRWRRTFFPSVSAARETREREAREASKSRDGRSLEEVDISRGENLNKTRGEGRSSSFIPCSDFLFRPLSSR